MNEKYLEIGKVDMVELTKRMLTSNLNDETKDKGGLTYLPWASCWKEVIKIDPLATYRVLKNKMEGPLYMLPIFGNSQSGFFVYVEVTIGSVTREMQMPVLDFRNKPMKNPDSFAINKSIMRGLVKAIALFGLGIYIFEGEDLPEPTDVDKPIIKEPKLDPNQQKLVDVTTRAKISLTKTLETLGVDKIEDVKNNKAFKDLVKKLEKYIEAKGL